MRKQEMIEEKALRAHRQMMLQESQKNKKPIPQAGGKRKTRKNQRRRKSKKNRRKRRTKKKR